jgi:hypothetical protein
MDEATETSRSTFRPNKEALAAVPPSAYWIAATSAQQTMALHTELHRPYPM